MHLQLPHGVPAWTVLAAVVVVAVVVAAFVVSWQRRRLARRLARRMSPWAKHPVVVGQVAEPEEWYRR